MQIFILGAFGWWCITAAIAVYIFFAIDKSIHLFWPIVALLFYVAFAQFSGLNLYEFVTHHPLESTGYVAGYFVLGFGWSFMKWWLYVNTIADKFKERKTKFRNSGSELSYETWERHNFMDNIEKPELTQSKSKITLWVIYWPFSVIWSILDDFVKKMINHLVTKFQMFYQSIVDRAFKGFDEK